MNVNPTGNAGIFQISNNIKSQGTKVEPPLSKEALEKMEGSVQESMKNHFDTVELSGNHGIEVLEPGDVRKPGPNAQLSTTFTNAEVSEKAETLSWLMDERSLDMETKVGFGMSQEQLAQHFGEIGRQIDAAFSAGKITQQEYDDLNAGLGHYTEAVTSQAERQAAKWEVLKAMAKTTRAMVEGGASKEQMAAYAKRNMETLQDRISEFVEKHCAIDRDLMSKLIQQVRDGENLIQPGTKQTYGKENMVGYFKDGYIPFVPDEYV